MSERALTDREIECEQLWLEAHQRESGPSHTFYTAYGCHRVARFLATIAALRARLAEVERERDEAVQRARVAEKEAASLRESNRRMADLVADYARKEQQAKHKARAAQAGDAGRGGGVGEGAKS